jgi:hypothetical protein
MMTKKLALAFMVAVFPLCSCAQTPDSGTTVNDEKQSMNLEYLQRNFKQLYSSNYNQFWKILREAAASASECRATADTVRFLELARIDSINAEFNEFFNKEIEQLAVRKTECFLSALYGTDEKTQTGVMKRLQHPLFVESTDLLRALKPFAQGKYGGLVNRYLADR